MENSITQRTTRARDNWREPSTKRKNESPERDFEAELTRISPLYNCLCIKIPDMIFKKGVKIIEHRRPFDLLLITPSQNFCLELKYDYGQLIEHQKISQDKINKINNSYYVVKKKVSYCKPFKPRKTWYVIMQNFQTLSKTHKIEDIFTFFVNPREYTSQEIMKQGMDEMMPSKKRKLNKVIY